MTTQDMLDERYGRRRSARSRRISWIVFGVIALIALGALSWTTYASSADATEFDGTAFQIDDEHAVTLTFQVTAPVDRRLACALEAQDSEHATVGWRVVTYPASSAHQRAFVEDIPTTSAATTGFVNACWVY